MGQEIISSCSSLGVEHCLLSSQEYIDGSATVIVVYTVGGADDEFPVRDHGEAGLRRPALSTFHMDGNSLLLKAKFQDTWRVVRSWGLPTVFFRCSYHGGHMACREKLRLAHCFFSLFRS